MSVEPKPAGREPDLHPEIAHLLLIDVVGYSKLLVNEQVDLLRKLNRVVRTTESFQAAEKNGQLIRLPTGDGMALIFFRSPEEPAHCAIEIAQALKGDSGIQLRMGVHSGPVNQVPDVNDRSNVAGAGINVAQRVMDCGDAGHILLSKHVADDLGQYRHWQPYLQDFGECEVKHGLRLHIVNLYKEGLGNPRLPEKLKRGRRWKTSSQIAARPLSGAEWIIGSAILLSAVALVVSFLLYVRPRPETVARIAVDENANSTGAILERSIAVLPFQNLGDEKQNATLTEGVQDEILTDLARVADLKVISRTSVMQYKTGDRNLRDIAKQLRVSHILEGMIQCVGNRVRVSAQLIDARTDTHVWAEHYDRNIADIFGLESELAEQIVSKLKAKLSPEAKSAIEEQPTHDLVAYALYLRAKALNEAINYDARLNKNMLEAARLLEEAVRRDPRFFLAYCRLARVHDEIYFIGIDRTPDRLALADAAIKTVIRLRPNAGETHLASAQHLYWGHRDYDGARRELALARNTLFNEPLIFELTGYLNRRQGHWKEATHELEQALDLDPLNLSTLQQLASTYEVTRRFAEAGATLDRALTTAPQDVETRTYRAAIYLWWRADPKPLHATLEAILREGPHAAENVADQLIQLGLCERNAPLAEQGVSLLGPDGYYEQSFPYRRGWCEGVVARMRGNKETAQAAFGRARGEVADMVHRQPAYAEALSVLGMIDAALGRKEDAIREGRRALELLPVKQDSLTGGMLIENVSIIYAWTGEKDRALEQLAIAAQIPGNVNYGYLRLHPIWDPLRGDPRFESIVASLAPDAKKP